MRILQEATKQDKELQLLILSSVAMHAIISSKMADNPAKVAEMSVRNGLCLLSELEKVEVPS